MFKGFGVCYEFIYKSVCVYSEEIVINPKPPLILVLFTKVPHSFFVFVLVFEFEW